MTLHVSVPKLRQFGDDLATLNADALPAHDYLVTYSRLEQTPLGIFSVIFDNTGELVVAIDSVLSKIASVSAHSSTEVSNAAGMYERTDATVAQQLDDTY